MCARKRLLDAHGNRRIWWHNDPDRPDDWLIEEEEDCEPYVAQAKQLADQRPGREWRHVAVVPHFVQARAIRENWDPADWKRWLNHPDNRMFRSWPGKI